ncbi:P-loop containing nucleoside triphosphate hydrolase protein [Ochromonadaceae sp. CCMP2298]|nr:P-loop containing nucleoside triphosphate hydrolase protein [Ochromonadaceae sp. CCMP2298]
MDTKIKVGVRIRPLNDKETEEGAHCVLNTDGRFVQTTSARKHNFEFDWAFDASVGTQELYEATCRPLIDQVFEGFNATFFAYGQTSSGKTHTLGGADMAEGVIPCALNDIFKRRAQLQKEGAKVAIELSYIEIYREECYDLLAGVEESAGGAGAGSRVRLELRETSGGHEKSGRTVLEGVKSQEVSSVKEVMRYLTQGGASRATGSTAMNATSSRSHSICSLSLRVCRVGAGAGTENGGLGAGSVSAQLHLVDLAGSERQKKTLAAGDALKEGISINRGLLALGNVVSALALKSSGEGGHIHVPYRESKLTRLLKDALGGNGLTVMLACVSPADANLEETVNTLRFALRASSIVNTARVNHIDSGKDSDSLMKEIAVLRMQLEASQGSGGGAGSGGRGARGGTLALGGIGVGGVMGVGGGMGIGGGDGGIMLRGALQLTCALKSLLLVCLEEGCLVADSDLIRIQVCTLQYAIR